MLDLLGRRKNIILLSDTEPAEDQIQNVIVGGGSGNLIERAQSVVKIQQDHLVRDLSVYRDHTRIQPGQ